MYLKLKSLNLNDLEMIFYYIIVNMEGFLYVF